MPGAPNTWRFAKCLNNQYYSGAERPNSWGWRAANPMNINMNSTASGRISTWKVDAILTDCENDQRLITHEESDVGSVTFLTDGSVLYDLKNISLTSTVRMSRRRSTPLISRVPVRGNGMMMRLKSKDWRLTGIGPRHPTTC
jgi:hypothetical protein